MGLKKANNRNNHEIKPKIINNNGKKCSACIWRWTAICWHYENGGVSWALGFWAQVEESLWKQHEFNYFEILRKSLCVPFFISLFLLSLIIPFLISIRLLWFFFRINFFLFFVSFLHHIAIRVSMRKFEPTEHTTRPKKRWWLSVSTLVMCYNRSW